MSAQHCAPAAGGPARELISFRVGVQEFCIGTMAVREIRGWTPATLLPHAPTYMRGVVNLRGAVLPIVDLSERLGLGAAEPTPSHVIIVTEVGAQVVGLLVSAVCDLLAVTDAAIQPSRTSPPAPPAPASMACSLWAAGWSACSAQTSSCPKTRSPPRGNCKPRRAGTNETPSWNA